MQNDCHWWTESHFYSDIEFELASQIDLESKQGVVWGIIFTCFCDREGMPPFFNLWEKGTWKLF